MRSDSPVSRCQATAAAGWGRRGSCVSRPGRSLEETGGPGSCEVPSGRKAEEQVCGTPLPLSPSPPATYTPSPPHALQALGPASVWELPPLGLLSPGHRWGGRGDPSPADPAPSSSHLSSAWLHHPAEPSISPLRPHLPHMPFDSPFQFSRKERRGTNIWRAPTLCQGLCQALLLSH